MVHKHVQFIYFFFVYFHIFFQRLHQQFRVFYLQSGKIFAEKRNVFQTVTVKRVAIFIVKNHNTFLLHIRNKNTFQIPSFVELWFQWTELMKWFFFQFISQMKQVKKFFSKWQNKSVFKYVTQTIAKARG